MPNPNLIDSLGTLLYIGPSDTSDVPPAESPDPWTLIGELASIGAIAFDANQDRNTSLTRVKDYVAKGVEPMPSVAITYNKISGGDEGQDALHEAQRDRTQNQWYWFKMVAPDTPDGSPAGTPTTVTFKAKVFGYTPVAQVGTSGVWTGGSTIVIDPDTFDYEEAEAGA
jgi:hypothetical protein